jgi:hypothetical protein
MEITPDAALNGGATVIVPTAAGAGTPPTVDAAYATATVASSHGLDALVRAASGSDIGAGVRNLDAAGQTVSIASTAGATVVYVATIRNESNLPEQVRVTRPAVPAGWTLQAFDAASGGANITSALATGWTKIVARGGTLTVRLEVTAAAALGGGAQCPLLLTARA